MGWSAGSELANKVWVAVRGKIPIKERKGVALKIFHLFSDHDTDSWEKEGLLETDSGVWQEQYYSCNKCEWGQEDRDDLSGSECPNCEDGMIV